MDYSRSMSQFPESTGAALEEISKIMKRHNLIGLVTVTNGTHAESYWRADAPWSLMRSEFDALGASVFVMDNPTNENDGRLKLTLQAVEIMRAEAARMSKVSEVAAKYLSETFGLGVVKVSLTQEVPEYNVLNDDFMPATIMDGIAYLVRVLTPVQKQCLIEDNLNGRLRDGFATHLRKQWELEAGNETPIMRNAREAHGLSHGLDVAALILFGMIAATMGKSVEAAIKQAEYNLKLHWKRLKRDPLTQLPIPYDTD